MCLLYYISFIYFKIEKYTQYYSINRMEINIKAIEQYDIISRTNTYRLLKQISKDMKWDIKELIKICMIENKFIKINEKKSK